MSVIYITPTPHHHVQQLFCVSILHHRKPEPFLSEILYRGAYEIDCIIDYQKPVMCPGECPDCYRRILRIVLVDIQLQQL